MQDPRPVRSVPSLDIKRYLGTWYEICRLPMKYEDEEASDITADYALMPDGRLRVDNRCVDADGLPSQSIGEARPLDSSNARLSVTFLPPLLRWLPFTRGDYWVLELDPQYQVSLVGGPDRKYLWLLARRPDLPDDQREYYLTRARVHGYDLTQLITPRQSGRKVSDALLTAA